MGAAPSMILGQHGFAVAWRGPLGPGVAWFEAWSRAEPAFARTLGTPGADLAVVPALWRLDDRIAAFWCEEAGAFAAAIEKGGSVGEAVCVLEGARDLALAPGSDRATLFCADDGGIVRVDVDVTLRPVRDPVRCVAERRGGVMLAAAHVHEEALLAYVHRGAPSFGIVATRGADQVAVRHPTWHAFESVDLCASGSRAALVLELVGGTLSRGLVGLDGKLIERPRPFLERHLGRLSAPRVVFREDDWTVLAREPDLSSLIVAPPSDEASFKLPRSQEPFAAAFWNQHYYALEVSGDEDGAELRLWRCDRKGEGQQQRVVRIKPSDAPARRTQLAARQVLSGLLARASRPATYREQRTRADLAADGCSLSVADEIGRLSLAFAPAQGGVRMRVVSTLGEDDLRLPDPPSSLVRLARWVRERVSPRARSIAERERAWGAQLAQVLGGTLQRVERAGAALILELALPSLPLPEPLDAWLRRLRSEHAERVAID